MHLRSLVFVLASLVSSAQIRTVSRRPLQLRLKKAIALATTPEGNADIRMAGEDILQAQSRSTEAFSALLPAFSAVVGEESAINNLAVLGLPSQLGGFSLPRRTGPLNIFNGRIAATQKILDVSAIRRFQASRGG